MFALDAAARLTRGLRGPHGTDQGERGAVLLYTGVDHMEGTVRVRLDAAGADEKWVHCVRSQDFESDDPDEFCTRRWAFREDCDVQNLESYLDGLKKLRQPVRLIIIDPASVFLDLPDGQNDGKLRAMIEKLGDQAARSGAAILFVAQPLKSGIGKRSSWLPIPRALADAARSVWMVVRDIDEPERRLLLPVRTHICAIPDGLGFSISDNRIDWEPDPVSLTAEQFLAMASAPKSSRLDEEELGELSRAAEWLKLRLNDGYVLSSIVREEARANGVSAITLRKAYLLLGCHKGKETKAGGRWFWRLPGQTAIPVPSKSIEVARSQSNLLEVARTQVNSLELFEGENRGKTL